MAYTDVFVIGGGPAGLAAAIAARRKGLRVVVADGNRPPIDKACGEGMMPNCLAAARAIGIEIPAAVGFELRGIRFHGAGCSVEANFPERNGLGVRRTALHRLLVDAAEKAGVELRWGTPVASLTAVDASWIIGADGSCSRVRRWAGLDAQIRNSRRFTYRQHYAIPPWGNVVEVHWGAGCQIYITPVDANEVGVALISREQNLRVENALERFPALRARLHGVPITSRGRGAITATMRLHHITRGNVALIGDASGSVDAITGEGLCLAFKQAALLADGMSRGDLSQYARVHPRLARRPAMMCRAMMMLDIGPRVREIGIRTLSAAPWVFEKLLQVHVA